MADRAPQQPTSIRVSILDPPATRNIFPDEIKRTSSCPPVGDEPHVSAFIPAHTGNHEASPRSPKYAMRTTPHHPTHRTPSHLQLRNPQPVRRIDAEPDTPTAEQPHPSANPSINPTLNTSPSPNGNANPNPNPNANPTMYYPHPNVHIPRSPYNPTAQPTTPKSPYTPSAQADYHQDVGYSPKHGYGRGGGGGNSGGRKPFGSDNSHRQYGADQFQGHNPRTHASADQQPRINYNHSHAYPTQQMGTGYPSEMYSSYDYGQTQHAMYQNVPGYFYQPTPTAPLTHSMPGYQGLQGVHGSHADYARSYGRGAEMANATGYGANPQAYQAGWHVPTPGGYGGYTPQATHEKTFESQKGKRYLKIEDPKPKAVATQPTAEANAIAQPANDATNIAPETQTIATQESTAQESDTDNSAPEAASQDQDTKQVALSEDEKATEVQETTDNQAPEAFVSEPVSVAEITTEIAQLALEESSANLPVAAEASPEPLASPTAEVEQVSQPAVAEAVQAVEVVTVMDTLEKPQSDLSTQSQANSIQPIPINQILKSRYLKLPPATITTLKKLYLYNPKPEVARLHEVIVPIVPPAPVVRPQFNTGEHGVVREFRSLINKITFTTYDTIITKIKEIKIDSIDLMKSVNSVIFETAVKQPIFCSLYARVCHDLSNVFPKFKDESNQEVTFRRILLTSCQSEFERKMETPDPNLSEEEKFMFRKKERMRQIGNIRLVGEIYKRGYLPDSIIEYCIKSLTTEEPNSILDPETIECLCQLLLTVGSKYAVPEKVESLRNCNAAFAKLKAISENTQYDLRTRFMCLDTIDARDNNWERRIKETGPKHLSEVHKEIKDEEDALQNRVNSLPKPIPASNTKVPPRAPTKYDPSMAKGLSTDAVLSFRPAKSWVNATKVASSPSLAPAGATSSQKITKEPTPQKELPPNKYSAMNIEELEVEVKKNLKIYEVSSEESKFFEAITQMKTNKSFHLVPKLILRHLAESKQENHSTILSLLRKSIGSRLFSRSEWKESLLSTCGDLSDWSMDAPMAPSFVSKAINVLLTENVLSLEDIYGPDGSLVKCDKDLTMPDTLATFACEIFSAFEGVKGRDALIAQLKKMNARAETWFQKPESALEAKRTIESLGFKDIF